MRLLLIFLLCVCASAATEVIKTIQPSSGDYTSVYNWEAGRQTNCVTADSIEIGQINGTWSASENAIIEVVGWTTDATRYIVITNSTSKHDGKYYGSASGAWSSNVTNDFCLRIREEYLRVYGLQAKVHISGSGGYNAITDFGIAAGGSDIRIVGCIVTSSTTSTGTAGGIYCQDADTTMSVVNCLVHDMTSGSAFGIRCDGGTMNVYNSTVVNSDTGIRNVGATMNGYNCLANGCTDGYDGTIGGNKNCSDIASDAPGTNPVTGNVTFVSESAPYDFHLSSGDTVAKDAGASDPGSGLYSNDIDLQTRSGSWDIGADEYVSAGTVNPQVIIITTQ